MILIRQLDNSTTRQLDNSTTRQLDNSTIRQLRHVVSHLFMQFLVLLSWFDYYRKNISIKILIKSMFNNKIKNYEV